jgi:hypothetical protein
MYQKQRERSESTTYGDSELWPEIGTRAFMRAGGFDAFRNKRGPWINVQESRYKYLTQETDCISVKMVIRDYLAAYVEWH